MVCTELGVHFLFILNQRIRSTAEGMKPLLMDLNVSKTLNCPYTITFYGALFTEVCCVLFAWAVVCPGNSEKACLFFFLQDFNFI